MLERFWSHLRCWSGNHDLKTKIVAVHDPARLRYLVVEQTFCTQCGVVEKMKPIGYARSAKNRQKS